MTGLAWLIADAVGASTWLAVGVAFVLGYALRITALTAAGKSPWRKSPPACSHDDGRPMLGRKLKGRSRREMALLGLTVRADDEIEVDPKLAQPAAGARP